MVLRPVGILIVFHHTTLIDLKTGGWGRGRQGHREGKEGLQRERQTIEQQSHMDIPVHSSKPLPTTMSNVAINQAVFHRCSLPQLFNSSFFHYSTPKPSETGWEQCYE